MEHLSNFDPEVSGLIKQEEQRQIDKIRLIASENYVSHAVLEATGNVLTNKYSEGYPGKRYYEGQQFIDPIETIAIERAKELFGAEHANVQPYSGSPANMAVYLAFVKPGDTVMGMSLSHGGHLTHGSPVSITGKYFNIVSYELDRDTGLLNYETIRELAVKSKPKMIIAGHSAYPRQIDFRKFREIADEVGAVLFVDMAHFAGLVAGGVHPSPVPYADVVSTTTHKTLRGPRGGMLLCKAEYAAAIDKAVFPGIQGGPHNHTTAGIAVALKEALLPEFKEYAAQVVKNAGKMADCLTSMGYQLVTGGTENHLLLIDLSNKNITGKQAAKALDKAGIVLNCNAVPYDTRKPFDPSGIRMGLAAVTSRGFKEAEVEKTAQWINKAIENFENEEVLENISKEVKELCVKFQPPGL
ncbi:Glycine hydroxymethyltransferase [Denitrovibrio acetiphilus DSM 12809]|uniref:Serine hydroxymethyltransferase n=1 Tax=Denitrovibrio acetiphilus (strain DSM 12809 / NBRC 114555 / N2460) TaxID=522772 RepID=D4H3I5_DENA2|nr:serine hydroxymethyltransferase [Denitrovibrio acetiphilus]ADD69087.1 Glycine hydroxymethyltransferase [Denitrovibrio acetiphilus DSM 12809]